MNRPTYPAEMSREELFAELHRSDLRLMTLRSFPRSSVTDLRIKAEYERRRGLFAEARRSGIIPPS